MTFTGFPEAALDFYDDLEMDNTKSFWEAHKAIYTESVKAPMVASLSARPAVWDPEGVPPVPGRPLRQGEANSFRDLDGANRLNQALVPRI